MTSDGQFPVALRGWVKSQSFCVVGGTGMIGRALAARLVELGARQVRSVSRHVPRGDAGIDFRAGAITDLDFVRGAITPNSVVFHLAALKYVGGGGVHPESYFEVNARGTWNVMEACRNAAAAKVVYASTWVVYGAPQQLPVAEAHPVTPLSVYGASKLAGEAAVRGYAEEFALPAVIARLGNVYCNEPDPEAVWGRIACLAGAGEDIVLRGLGSERDYIHLDDAVEGLIRLAAADAEPRCVTVNLGTGRGTSVGSLAEIAARAVETRTGRKLAIPVPPPSAPERIPAFYLAIEQLEQITGWRPRVSVEEGINRCISTVLSQKAI